MSLPLGYGSCDACDKPERRGHLAEVMTSAGEGVFCRRCRGWSAEEIAESDAEYEDEPRPR